MSAAPSVPMISFGVLILGGVLLLAVVGIAVGVIVATQGSRRNDDDE